MSTPKTRKATAAERLAARALGQEVPDVIELPTKSAAQRHAERLGIEAPARLVPEGMSTGEYHLHRFRARSAQPAGGSPDAA